MKASTVNFSYFGQVRFLSVVIDDEIIEIPPGFVYGNVSFDNLATDSLVDARF